MKTPKFKYVRIRSRHPSHEVLRKNPSLRFDGKSVFRLGSTTQVDVPHEINTVEAVKVSSNKLKMKEAFKNGKIQSPKMYTITDPFNTAEIEKYPLVAKKVLGSRGRGMQFIENEEQLLQFFNGNTQGYYLEQYFSGAREYRLHVSALGCFYACRKLRKSDAEERWYFNSNNCIWATEKEQELDEDGNFVKFTNVDSEQFNKPTTWCQIVAQSQKALSAVGLDVGAVDVRVNTKGDFQILETNSAPSFGEKTTLMYLEHLPQLMNHKYGLNHKS